MKMTPARRIERAIERIEEASGNLMRAAFAYGTSDRGTWSDQKHAQDVQACARKYAAALRGLQRANRV